MKKIVCFGDSITDMGRTSFNSNDAPWALGLGYPQFLNGMLSINYPNKYVVVNNGISGNEMHPIC